MMKRGILFWVVGVVCFCLPSVGFADLHIKDGSFSVLKNGIQGPPGFECKAFKYFWCCSHRSLWIKDVNPAWNYLFDHLPKLVRKPVLIFSQVEKIPFSRGHFVIVPTEKKTNGLVVFHELIHQWFGEQIVFSADLKKQRKVFVEGVAEFLALQLLVKSNIYTKQQYSDRMKKYFVEFQRNHLEPCYAIWMNDPDVNLYAAGVVINELQQRISKGAWLKWLLAFNAPSIGKKHLSLRLHEFIRKDGTPRFANVYKQLEAIFIKTKIPYTKIKRQVFDWGFAVDGCVPEIKQKVEFLTTQVNALKGKMGGQLLSIGLVMGDPMQEALMKIKDKNGAITQLKYLPARRAQFLVPE
jgi:hypothetical protein